MPQIVACTSMVRMIHFEPFVSRIVDFAMRHLEVLGFGPGLDFLVAGRLRFGLLCPRVSPMRLGLVRGFGCRLGLWAALHLGFGRGGGSLSESGGGKHAGQNQD